MNSDLRRASTTAEAGPLLPRPLVAGLYATIGTFYLAGIYDSQLAAQIATLKWLSLVFLILLAAPIRASSVKALPSRTVFPAMLLSAVAFSLFFSPNLVVSVSTYASVVLVVTAGHFVARHLSTAARRRQFFDIIANTGRMVIASAAIMWPLGLNLGRGEGRFSAWTDNPNTLGLMIAPGLIILIANVIERQRGRLFQDAFFIVAGLFVLLQTGSRASILWVAVSVLAFWFVRAGVGLSLYIGILVLGLGLGWGGELKS